MTETLYLDLLFLVNLAVDLWLLLLTGLVLKETMRRRKGKLFLGAAAGAGMGCVLIFLPVASLSVWVFLAVFLPSFLMTRIAFGVCRLEEAARRILVLWMTALLMGGIFSLLESVSGSGILVKEGRGMLTSVWHLTPWPLGQFGLVFFTAAGTLWSGVVFFRREQAFRSSLYEVTLYYRGRQKEVRALLDTGNQLYEPYGHKPVHILERSAWPEVLEAVSEIICVPFCTVGKEHGILPALRMERMEIRQRGQKVRVLEHPWVAISETPLSPHHKYEMLLHGE